MAQPPSTRRSLTRAVVPALGVAGLAGVAALVMVGTQQLSAPVPSPPQGCVLNPPPALGGAISLIGQNGQAVTQADFAGRPALIYFGFTHCPDICPTTMYTVAEAIRLANLPDAGTALITIDPARDTPEAMAQYVASSGFPTGLKGLTGTEAQIDAVARAFGVAVQRPAPDANGDYNVGHSSFLYLMDADWKMKALVSTIGQTPQAIADCLRAGLAAP